MQNSQNVWVDGSLRDGPWFEKVFREVRARFPHYQIAIFEVRNRDGSLDSKICSHEARPLDTSLYKCDLSKRAPL